MLLTLLALFAGERRDFTAPEPADAEYGHGLTAEEAGDGWISLFDGQTTFGWSDGASAEDGLLTGGTTTCTFGDYELKADVETGGRMTLGGGEAVDVPAGAFTKTVQGLGAGPIKLGSGVAVRKLVIKPLNLAAAFNGKDLTGWSAIRRPGVADERQTKWTVEDGLLRGAGGPGALELQGAHYGDFVLQVDVRCRGALSNGGVFVRSIPGDFLNGYEAQIFNGCYDRDPAKPAKYSTGAIDDRQGARRVVSRDGQTFTMTVIAAGPHLSTWVNGYQMTDWTDERDKHDNPRQGRREEPGSIQLQAHDADTDLEFRGIRVGEVK